MPMLTYESTELTALADRLDARSQSIIDRTVTALHTDPCWEAYFAAHGETITEQDVGFHLDALSDALHETSLTQFLRYTHWAQTTLLSRGLSILQVAQQYTALGDAMLLEVTGDLTPALTYLDYGRRTLR